MQTGNTPTEYLIFMIIYMQAMLVFTNSRKLLCSAAGISFKLSKIVYQILKTNFKSEYFIFTYTHDK